MSKGPKVLLIDIETKPILAHVWNIWNQDVSLSQIKEDWSIISWSAKWLGESKIFYQDQRNSKNLEDDKRLLKNIWKLLDEADIVVGHNSKKFDVKKLNARFIKHGMGLPSSFKQIDTLLIAKKYLNLTSNKLEFLAHYLGTKVKKLTNRKFAGFDLWKECLKNNIAAWEEMKIYNKRDVEVLEQVFQKLLPLDNTINFNLYHDSTDNICKCGNKEFNKNGYAYTSLGKFQRWTCKKCGSETRDRKNLLSKEKVESLRVKV